MTSLKERKSFICELSKCKQINDNLFQISNESIKFSQIWIQGFLIDVKLFSFVFSLIKF
jgi:hypothetical protein